MRRLRPLRAAVSLLLIPAQLLAAPPVKLVWDPPCSLHYTDGKPFEKPLETYECDWFKARYGTEIKGMADAFNTDTDLQAQSRFLTGVRAGAAKDFKSYTAAKKKLLEETDPARFKCKGTADCARLAVDAKHQVNHGCLTLADPFLWPKYTQSYIYPVPEMRDRYFADCAKRRDELDARIQAASADLVQKEKKKIELVKDDPKVAAKLDKLYTGGSGGGATPVSAVPGAPAKGVSASYRALPMKPSAYGKEKPEAAKAPPVLPESSPAAAAKRNYFARGYQEGMKRLADEARVEAWHLSGYSKTVGEPEGKAGFVEQQQGDSCGVGAQQQAMAVRGDPTPLATLAQQSHLLGVYKESVTEQGKLEGTTTWDQMGQIARFHGYTIRKKLGDAGAKDLKAAIYENSDAVVRTRVAKLWNDNTLPADAGHFVLVTGLEERAKDGKVLGYYINDTGTGEGGRYVPARDFERAFSGQLLEIDK